ncbi:ribbon-helix-helix protein, CopG family [Eubacterium sp. TF05-29]|uniref:plasmid mobilization protein n=1 Tax=Longicatena caecimuris TaxID=1796635 RepID=UPI000E731F5B|nr:ribbon-helix-helix protein, CopG family [Longicatena caecimuris]RJV72775.1 ribbon-helix-helix protein, CopG family [Eubacterium sp. AM47-9]RJW06392.1 ribbon-helix-helix protein, CopG family [Eubacterium sp. AM28-8LB]RJW29263.1 ribbon-helix-helix protein, CopG family [Eubacterium sp. TF05-29]
MEKKKMGRPIVGNKKDIMLRIRIDQETLDILDKNCKNSNLSRSEYIRKLIKEA